MPSNTNTIIISPRQITSELPQKEIYSYSEGEQPYGLLGQYNKTVETLQIQKNKPAVHKRKQKFSLNTIGVDFDSEDSLIYIFDCFEKNKDDEISLNDFKITLREHFEDYGTPMSTKDVDRLFAILPSISGSCARKSTSKKEYLNFNEFCIIMLKYVRK